MKNIEEKHISVLYKELVEAIEIFAWKQNIVVDCTLWLWGHAEGIIEKLNFWDVFIWFDADSRNLVLARERLEKIENIKVIENIKEISEDRKNIIFINSNFLNLKLELEKRWIKEITWIYYDLWISSVHIDEVDRWFSFRTCWPLDMRFDTSCGITAKEVVNSYKKEKLYEIFRNYGEEPASKKISEAIYRERREKKIETTKDLLEIIEKNSSHPKVKTRIFQAIRIEVNKELENIKISLEDAIELLTKDWTIFVISFHSLEDRITKQTFKKESRDCFCSDMICICKHIKTLKILTKKPILPTNNEIQYNSRARSAKARIAKKL